jgi:hypothetical protein
MLEHPGVVGASVADEELAEEGGFVAAPPRGVPGRLVGRCQDVELLGHQPLSVTPGDRLAVVAAGSLHQRLGQPALLLQQPGEPGLAGLTLACLTGSVGERA